MLPPKDFLWAVIKFAFPLRHAWLDYYYYLIVSFSSGINVEHGVTLSRQNYILKYRGNGGVEDFREKRNVGNLHFFDTAKRLVLWTQISRRWRSTTLHIKPYLYYKSAKDELLFSTPGLQFPSFYHTIMSFFSFSTFPGKEYVIIFYASSHLPLSHHFGCVVFSLLFLEYGDHGVGTSWPRYPHHHYLICHHHHYFPLVCFSFLRLSWNSKPYSSLNY